MNGTIRQMYLKSLKALMLAEARVVDMLRLGIPFHELRCTFDDVDITTGDIVSEIRLISFACSSFPGLHHCVITVVLT